MGTLRRRELLTGAAGAALAVQSPRPAIAQNAPLKIGLLTVKTGPLAQGGIQMEQGISLFLKHRGNKLAGRPAELVIGDTGGNPADQDQGAGADRARPCRFYRRPARGFRTLGDQRVRRAA
jgi:hypothetical protein